MRTFPRNLVLAAACAVVWCGTARAQEESEAPRLLRSDSEAPYVHNINIYDHDGTAISPEDDPAMPYSPTATCGKCHEVGKIAGGWHFNADVNDVPAGRAGEPWLVIDGQTGTVLPISGRGWPGTYKPADVGLSNWEFVLRFGRQMPGGSYGTPDEATIERSEKAARWRVSGQFEVDCMICHSADNTYDPTEVAKQIEAENFRWAPTAALGLAYVRGEARKALDDWDPLFPPDPDYPERAGPQLEFDENRFDSNKRVFFNIAEHAPNERCYFCHSFREVGPDATPDLIRARDVHLSSGLMCADCHANEIGHQTVRGFPGEAAERDDPTLAVYTCEGCHLGTADPHDPEVELGGRYGAPRPLHRGFPPLHFRELACTACHSGPWPQDAPRRFQTAMAHELGLSTRDRTDDQPPEIVAPIFARQADGKIAPQRMVWPSFWARVEGEAVKPLMPEAVRRAAGKALPKSDEHEHKAERLSDERIAAVLAQLATTQSGGTPAYVRDGKLYKLTGDRKLESAAHAAAQPYRWSLGHNVRPAAQALGINGCTDCHGSDSPVYFGQTTRPDSTGDAPKMTMVEFRGGETDVAEVWALGFTMRPIFKAFGLICAALVALVILRALLQGFRGEPTRRSGFSAYEQLFLWAALVGVVIQFATAYVADWFGFELEDWLLLAHMGGAGLLIFGLTGSVLQLAPRCRFGAGDKPAGLSRLLRGLFWIVATIGLVVMGTMLSAMLPVFGYDNQVALLDLHATAGLTFVIATAVFIVVTLAGARTTSKESR